MNLIYKRYSLFFLALVLMTAPAAFATAAECLLEPTSRTTGDFMNEIPSLNTQLKACPVPLNSAAKAVFGKNQVVQLSISRYDGTTSVAYFTIANSALSGVTTGGGSPGYEIAIGECEFDSILNSASMSGAFSYLFTQGTVKVIPKGFWNKLVFGVAKIFGKGAIKKAATPVSPACKKENGAVCQHGGECQSSNCVGEGQGPPWTYRCSCDAFKYLTSCPPAPVVQTNPSGKRPDGELCDHGGQCESGNCIGVGQGPPWTYRCSCDPGKYSTSCPAKPTVQTDASGKRPAGELCDHGGQCKTGNCVGVGQGPPWTYRCSCDTSKYTTGC